MASNDDYEDDIEIQINFEDDIDIYTNYYLVHTYNTDGLNYGISDGCPDSYVVGQDTYIIHGKGYFTFLIGYDSANTKLGCVPIVLVYTKNTNQHKDFSQMKPHT